jgi:hypothetical protein
LRIEFLDDGTFWEMKKMKELIAKVREWLKAAGKKDEEIDMLLKDVKIDEPSQKKVDLSQITDPALKAIVDALNSQISILTEQNKTLLSTLQAEKDARDKAVKAQQDQMSKDKEAKVMALVALGLKDGKIAKKDEAWLKQYAEDNLDRATAWVKDAPVLPGFKAEPEKKESTNDASQPGSTSLKNYFDHKQEFNEAAKAAFATAKN